MTEETTKKISGIIRVCVDLTEEEYKEIENYIENTRLTLFGFVWSAIQEKLGKKE